MVQVLYMLEITFFTVYKLTFCQGSVCILFFIKSKSFRNLASKICFEKLFYGKRQKKDNKSCSCLDLNPGPCAWQVGMLTITLEQIIQIITRFLV